MVVRNVIISKLVVINKFLYIECRKAKLIASMHSTPWYNYVGLNCVIEYKESNA